MPTPALLTVDSFLQIPELIEKAAASRSLTVKGDRREFETEDVGTYKLDEGLLKALGKVGFTFKPGVIPPHNAMVYLDGHSNQKGQEVFDSDCWDWKRTEKNPYLAVRLRLSVSERERGIVAVPHVGGNCIGGACHRPTINKLVIAIASYFPDAHPLLKEMTLDSYPIINWNSIGLGGVRSISHLFEEWRHGHNELVSKLANSNISPFSPDPTLAGHNYFVVESDQPGLFGQWEKQLQEFKNRLY